MLVLLALLGVLLTACGGGTAVSPPPTTPTTDPVLAMQASLLATSEAAEAGRAYLIAKWQHNLADAAALWEAHDIDDYTITVRFSPESTLDQSVYTVRVVDGEVVEENADCIDGGGEKGCIIEQVDSQNLTVPGILQMTKHSLEQDLIDVEYPLEFHETYGYPFQVGLETNSVYGFYWRVDSFTAN